MSTTNNCEPIKSCGQTSIPQTDESQINCENITTTDCVNLVKDYLSLQVSSADNLTILLDKIIEKLFKPTKHLQSLSFDNQTGILTATLTDNSNITVDLSILINEETLQSVQAGTNITIDNTDPLNPIINSTATTDQNNTVRVIDLGDLNDTGNETLNLEAIRDAFNALNITVADDEIVLIKANFTIAE